MTCEHTNHHIAEVVTEDHRGIRELITALEVADCEPTRRRRLMDDLIGELSRHLAAEEQVLYPAVQRKLSAEEAETGMAEHTGITYVLKCLERMPAMEPRFDVLLTELSGRVRANFRVEEDMLATLTDACTHEEIADLGRRFRTARQTGPTRPHPAAPHTPPANWVVDPALAAVDHLRDAVRIREV
ncbi:hemerythrin domain-containing protein [Fodinicola acaciae]|uniref:hemerythrin domain-containing protein n=1 Tax=Fodinicola acaciae TaxID=2681555 RepID=UPI0013D537F8|nr:hemerythrin domain-containing protein [Fodinicola acaciae]